MKTIIATTLIALTALTTTAQAGVTKHGDWKVYDNVDAVTGEREVYMVSFAIVKDSQYGFTKPFMGVTCSSIYFGGLDIVSTGNTLYRTDTMSKPTKFRGDEWQGSDGVSINHPNSARFWSKYDRHFKNSIEGSYALARFDSYSRVDQTIKVSLKGFTPAIKALSDACLEG